MNGKQFIGVGLLTLSLALCGPADAADASPVQVGATGTLTLQLPDGARAVQVNDDADLVVSLSPGPQADGTTSYTVNYVPTRAGMFDLRDYLRTADGQPIAANAPLTVSAFTALPPDVDLSAADVPRMPMPRVGGYKALVAAAVVCWVGLLVPLIFWKRKPRVKHVPPPPAVVELTADEHLELLVRKLRRAGPSLEQKVRLESLLLAHWRRSSGLHGLTMAQALDAMRRTPAIAAMVDDLERCLHAPADAGGGAGLVNVLDAYEAASVAKGRV